MKKKYRCHKEVRHRFFIFANNTTLLGWRPPLWLEAIAIRLEAIAIRVEAIPIRLEAITSRLETIASRLEAITIYPPSEPTPFQTHTHHLRLQVAGVGRKPLLCLRALRAAMIAATLPTGMTWRFLEISLLVHTNSDISAKNAKRALSIRLLILFMFLSNHNGCA